MTKIAIISGSQRINGNSGRIAKVLAAEVKQQLGFESYVLDLAQNPLPLWDEGLWGQSAPEGYTFADWDKEWQPVAQELAGCDGVIVIAPEYNGTAPAALTNFFHIVGGGQELNHKPGLLVAVSGSRNGAYPIAEMRSFSYKNCKLNYIPEHLIIREANYMLQAEVESEYAESDAYIRERITWTLDIFAEYVKALKQVRASGKTKTEKFGFGM